MENTCKCENKCYCKGILLIILGLFGFLAYFSFYTLPYLALIWPLIAVIAGIMSVTGICCCAMKKK